MLAVRILALLHIVDTKNCSYFKKHQASWNLDGSCMDCWPTVDVFPCAGLCASKEHCAGFVYRGLLYLTHHSATVGAALHSTFFQNINSGTMRSRVTSSESDVTLIVSGWSSSSQRLAAFNFHSYNWTYFKEESTHDALVYHPGDGKLYFCNRNSMGLFSKALDHPPVYNSVRTFKGSGFSAIVTLAIDSKDNFLFVLIRHGPEMFKPATAVQLCRIDLKHPEGDAVMKKAGSYVHLGNNLAVDTSSRCVFVALNGKIYRYTYELNSNPTVLWKLRTGFKTPLDFDGQIIYAGQGTTITCLLKGQDDTYRKTDDCKGPLHDKNISDIIATQRCVVYVHHDGEVTMYSRATGKQQTLSKPFTFVSVAALVAQSCQFNVEGGPEVMQVFHVYYFGENDERGYDADKPPIRLRNYPTDNIDAEPKPAFFYKDVARNIQEPTAMMWTNVQSGLNANADPFTRRQIPHIADILRDCPRSSCDRRECCSPQL